MKKDDLKKDFFIYEDSGNESGKSVNSLDALNLKDLSIGKPQDEYVSVTPNTQEKKGELVIDNEGQDSIGDWGNIRINKDPIEDLVDTPKLFDEETQEGNAKQEGVYLYQESDIEVDEIKAKQDKLVIDKEGFLITKKTDLEKYSSYEPKAGKGDQESSEGLLKKISSFLASLFILVIIIFSIISIIVSLELVSKDKTGRFTNFFLSKLPIGSFERLEDKIIVSQQSGRWVSTRDGFIYVVSGRITNSSDYDINHIKIKGEFLSGGKKLYEQVVYAGNTFSDAELKTLLFEDMMQKLQRKNGDINFNYPTKLAGLNYDIKPDESVPFFIVFPSKSRVLGLKYNIGIVGFEKASLE